MVNARDERLAMADRVRPRGRLLRSICDRFHRRHAILVGAVDVMRSLLAAGLDVESLLVDVVDDVRRLIVLRALG